MVTLIRSCAILSTFMISLGCGVEGPSDLPYPHQEDDEGSSAGQGGSNIGQGAGSSGSPTSASGGPSGSGGAPTTSSSSTGIGTASSGTAGSVTGGGVTGPCTPDGDDNLCFVCAKQQCCPEVQACVEDPACPCWIDCVADTLGDVTLCAGQCGLPGGAILDLLDCAGTGCSSDCGL